MQTAMIALILLTSMSSFSCDVLFFFRSIAFFLPAVVHSALPICLFEPTIRPEAYLGGDHGAMPPPTLGRQDRIISLKYCSMQNCSMATSFVSWAESLSTQKDRIWVKTYFFLFFMFLVFT